MSQSTLQKRTRYHSRTVRSKRDAIIAIANKLYEDIGEIQNDRFLTRSESRARIARARHEAEKRIDSALEDAREAVRLARGFVASELNRIVVTPQAEDRIRRLIDLKKAPNDILKTAVELGDQETLAALRREISWGLVPAGSGDFSGHLDRALASLAPDGGDELAALVELTNNPALTEAAKVAIRMSAGGEGVGTARMAYAFAAGDTAGEASADDGGGDDA